MGKVSASSSIEINKPAADVLAAVADYAAVRPRILSHHYRDYAATPEGAKWTLQATENRERHVDAVVEVDGDTVIETDKNSSMVTSWGVDSTGDGAVVTVATSWNGADGIGGFFEGIFAPMGLRKIQAEVLKNLKHDLEA